MTTTITDPILEVRDLRVSIDEQEILRGVNLTVHPGEVHAIMGPNGSGKSTLANTLAGRPEYTVTSGQAVYRGMDLLDMEPEDRAREGVFLAFQYPVELPGVRAWQFLKAAVDARRVHDGEEEMGAREFDRLLRAKVAEVEIDPELVRRSVNEGFSGGEKKRNEVLQMALLEPTLSLLDETDSGLDIDALRIVADGVNRLRRPDNAAVVVTHYQRILNYITPDQVHVLVDGRIVRSGGPELAEQLEAQGYDWVREEAGSRVTPMTTPANPALSALTDADWQRLPPQTQQYVYASFELLGKSGDYLRDGDLRQASEKGWGAAAQMVKAVAENWKDAEVVHGRHQDLRALVAGLATAEREPDLDITFRAAQDLHENFYENNLPQYIVDLELRQVNEFITKMAPQLRRSRPPRGFHQGR